LPASPGFFLRDVPEIYLRKEGEDMADREISQNQDICSHGRGTGGGNLMHTGTEYRKVEDGSGLLIGFKKVKKFKCKRCLKEIEKITPGILPLKEY
jgi:hypothetical protein